VNSNSTIFNILPKYLRRHRVIVTNERANLTLEAPVQLWVDTNLDASIPANRHQYYRVLPGD